MELDFHQFAGAPFWTRVVITFFVWGLAWAFIWVKPGEKNEKSESTWSVKQGPGSTFNSYGTNPISDIPYVSVTGIRIDDSGEQKFITAVIKNHSQREPVYAYPPICSFEGCEFDLVKTGIVRVEIVPGAEQHSTTYLGEAAVDSVTKVQIPVATVLNDVRAGRRMITVRTYYQDRSEKWYQHIYKGGEKAGLRVTLQSENVATTKPDFLN